MSVYQIMPGLSMPGKREEEGNGERGKRGRPVAERRASVQSKHRPFDASTTLSTQGPEGSGQRRRMIDDR
jgi:hypothetical protein